MKRNPSFDNVKNNIFFWFSLSLSSVGGLVVKSIVAIDGPRVRVRTDCSIEE